MFRRRQESQKSLASSLYRAQSESCPSWRERNDRREAENGKERDAVDAEGMKLERMATSSLIPDSSEGQVTLPELNTLQKAYSTVSLARATSAADEVSAQSNLTMNLTDSLTSPIIEMPVRLFPGVASITRYNIREVQVNHKVEPHIIQFKQSQTRCCLCGVPVVKERGVKAFHIDADH